MEKLKRAYGAVKYSSERCSIIFENLSGLPIESFRNQVDTFIAERDKAPLLGEFKEAFAGQMLELKRQSVEKKLAHLDNCVLCSNTGAFICYETETGNGFVFQCSCLRGKLLQPAYPAQYAGMEKRFSSHRAWVAGKYHKPKFDKTHGLIKGFVVAS